MIANPRQRWWTAVVLYAALALMWLVFTRVTVLMMQEPRGGPVAASRLTWTESEWKFSTKEGNGGSVEHYLVSGGLKLSLCDGSPAGCLYALFPKPIACTEIAQEQVFGVESALARCNQLQGLTRYGKRLTVGHFNGYVAAVSRKDGRGAQLLFSRELIRPLRAEQPLVLLTIFMFGFSAAVFYAMAVLGLPRLMRTWANAQGEWPSAALPSRPRVRLAKLPAGDSAAKGPLVVVRSRAPLPPERT